MNDPIVALGFVSIFHIIGGVAVGSALRGLRKGFTFRKVFFLVWGVLFGCMPLALGAQTFLKTSAIYLFAMEVFVLAGAILGAALIPDWVLESYNSADLFRIGFGGLFFLIGLITGTELVRTDLVAGLVFGGIFGGVGAAMLFFGLRSLLQRSRL